METTITAGAMPRHIAPRLAMRVLPPLTQHNTELARRVSPRVWVILGRVPEPSRGVHNVAF